MFEKRSITVKGFVFSEDYGRTIPVDVVITDPDIIELIEHPSSSNISIGQRHPIGE